MNSLELCAGAGGQAQGLERSGFEHEALVEIDTAACNTLRFNRPGWNVLEGDLSQFDAGVWIWWRAACPALRFPNQVDRLCDADKRNASPDGIRFVNEVRPRAVMTVDAIGILDATIESRYGVTSNYHA